MQGDGLMQHVTAGCDLPSLTLFRARHSFPTGFKARHSFSTVVTFYLSPCSKQGNFTLFKARQSHPVQSKAISPCLKQDLLPYISTSGLSVQHHCFLVSPELCLSLCPRHVLEIPCNLYAFDLSACIICTKTLVPHTH